MANLIKSKVTTKEGIELNGAYVRNFAKEVDTEVIKRTGQLSLSMLFYASEQAYLNGFDPITPIYSLENQARISLTFGLSNLSGVEDALMTADAKIKEYLQTIYEVVE